MSRKTFGVKTFLVAVAAMFGGLISYGGKNKASSTKFSGGGSSKSKKLKGWQRDLRKQAKRKQGKKGYRKYGVHNNKSKKLRRPHQRKAA